MSKNIILISFCTIFLGCSESTTDSSPNEIAIQFANTSKRPLKFSGSLEITDAVVDDTGPIWAVGLLVVENSTGDILVEFNGNVLQEAGITDEFEYPEIITLWLNDAKNEFYQVTKIE